ncbi:MAG: glutathione S-transferase family protein [Usitatibacteraceae bacterium]
MAKASTSTSKAAKTAKTTKTAALAKSAATATITISSKNYSSWSLRGWLMVKFAKLDCREIMVSPDDASARKELLLLSPSMLVPCLEHEGIKVWDTLAIAEYLNEIKPTAGLLPSDVAARAHCRAICGEMHSGFSSLRSALPMNLKASFPGHKIWLRADADIERIKTIWRDCLKTYGGPFLFGKRSMADAMYAPVVTRFKTYDVKLDKVCAAYAEEIMAMPEMVAWIAAAKKEHEEIDELDIEF